MTPVAQTFERALRRASNEQREQYINLLARAALAPRPKSKVDLALTVLLLKLTDDLVPHREERLR